MGAMNALELSEYLVRGVPDPRLKTVVVSAVGVRGVIGGLGGHLPQVQSCSQGIDHDSGFVFIHPQPAVYLRRPGERPKTDALWREEDHVTLDRVLAEYLAEHPGTLPSRISVLELLKWHHGKTVEASGG